uniref:Uncharacterized protein n=1 Tax=Oryza rufipogon TaxID=4529 RepID=A0A0E0Q8R4_ORYRU
MEADRVMQWLNGKELRSVVFVSLAMMAHGLELSGAAFVHGAGGGRVGAAVARVRHRLCRHCGSGSEHDSQPHRSPLPSLFHRCLPLPPRLADRLSPLSRQCGRPPLSLSPSKAHQPPILFSPF